MRDQGHRQDQDAVGHGRGPDAAPLKLARRPRGARHGDVTAPLAEVVQEEEGDRSERDAHQGDGPGGIQVEVPDDLEVDQRRQDVVLPAQHCGHAEASQGLHEDDDHPGGDGRRHQGQGDRPGDAEASGPHDLRALLQRGVGRGQGAVDQQEDVREISEREGQDDPRRPVDGGELEAERALQQVGEDAVSSEEQDPGIGPEKRRNHEGQGAQRQKERLARNLDAGHEEGHGQPDEQRQHAGGQAHRQGMEQGLSIQRGRGEPGEMLQGEVGQAQRLVEAEEAVQDDARDGIDEEDQQDQRRQAEDDGRHEIGASPPGGRGHPHGASPQGRCVPGYARRSARSKCRVTGVPASRPGRRRCSSARTGRSWPTSSV